MKAGDITHKWSVPTFRPEWGFRLSVESRIATAVDFVQTGNIVRIDVATL